MTPNVNTAQEDQISPVKPISEFRSWVHNLWVDNCEERFRFGETKLSKSEYWHTFKWWVKREYQKKIKLEKDRNERRNQLYR
jgi:hypothetical protein